MFNFDQVPLQQCGAGIRSAFDAVRLVPCRAAGALNPASGASAASGVTTAQPIHTSTHGEPSPPGRLESAPAGVAGIRVQPVPFRWNVPGADLLVRWFVTFAAGLSSLLAAVGAFRQERRYRERAVYRTRFHA